MGLFDIFRKKNKEEAAKEELNGSQEQTAGMKGSGASESGAETDGRAQGQKLSGADPEEKLEAAEQSGQNRLEECLKAFEETKKVQEGVKLLQVLMRHAVSVPVSMSMTVDALDSLNAGRDFNLDRAMEVKPDVMTVNGKERALPLFTSRDKIPMEYLQKKQLSVSEMPFRQMCQLFLEQKDRYDCIAINPQTTNMRVPREVAESLLGLRRPNPQQNKLQIGILPKVPEKLEAAVKQVGSAHPEVERIFLQFLVKEQAKSFLLVVDGDMEKLRSLLKALAEEFREASGGSAASVATYAGQLKKVLEDNKVQPVYMKEG